MNKRMERALKALEQTKCQGVIITNLKNIFYLTGFSGSSAMIYLSQNRQLFFTDARYTLMAKDVVKDFDIVETREYLKSLSNIITLDNIDTIGFDSEVSYHFYQEIRDAFPTKSLEAQINFIENLRMIKDESEVAIIRKACQISDQAFLDVLDFIKPNQTTELDVMNFLDMRMRQLGASGPSFDFIVASGFRSAMPHGVASDKVIKSGESLTMDFGCYYNHYVSDITRTIHIGEVSDEERLIYDIVLKSNQALINQVKAGMTRSSYDKIARDVIEEAGYGQFFTHGIGHGIGLDIHEIPYFGQSDERILSGMTLTDEPGIYLDHKYGVRIEDDLLVTDTGCEVLTLAPKELIVI